LATHDNSFIRYFEGHEATVTNLSLHPGSDNFISCSLDNTVRLWNMGSKQWSGKLFLNNPTLAAWDPSGTVFAIACPVSACVLLYDYRNYHKAPFNTFDVARSTAGAEQADRGYTSLEFSNDGKHILVGSSFGGHSLLDAFDGSLKAYLRKPAGGTKRLAPGDTEGGTVESSGDCCFSPDGRYVISGSKKDLLVWDTLSTPNAGPDRVLEPTHVLEEKRESAVVAFNPRYNMIATADQELMFWLPDPHA